MKYWNLIFLFSVFTTGCVSSQIIPEKKLLLSLRAIDVVPIENSPLIFNALNGEERTIIDATLKSNIEPMVVTAPNKNGSDDSLAKSAATLMFVPVPIVRSGASMLDIIGGTTMLAEAASAGKEAPNETASIERGQPKEIWTPSVEFAKTAVATLQNAHSLDTRMIDGYVKLPITDRSVSWHLENWLGPIRRYYNLDKSTVNYSAIASNNVDFILEVGVMNYEFNSGTLCLQVFVKLIDHRTNQVLGRVRNTSLENIDSLAPLLQNNAEKMKHLILEIGNRLLVKCLVELGLLPE